MRFSTKTSKAAAAGMTALALVLPLAACGSDKETTSSGLSTAAEAPDEAESVDGAAKESEENSGDKDNADKEKDKDAKDGKDEKKSEKKDGESGDAGEVPTIANPFADGQYEQVTHEPIAGGQEASQADIDEMTKVVEAVSNPESLASWTRVILDNSCKAVTDPAMEELERQGMTLEAVEEAARMQEEAGMGIDLPRSEISLADVRVDGDRASASVTARNDSGKDTQTQLFQREDGRWKLCN
ncbi:nuclear transport factor 2 family protein [Corynebacterium sp. HMSC071B10]|uniref:nuclear transport factor 2 family protein n=1 Tax=Corynebacterium sp. HMSC071B10 TaxID=1739494 RepID=UPI00114C8FE9|nr:nuclear transport factor 2 family protein [Corynebacterium sp. HMSC071B10]